MKLLRLVCLLCGFLWGSAATFAQEARTALIMGVWEYDSGSLPSLPGVDNDLVTMSAKLRELGFEVVMVSNPTLGDAEKAVDDFGARLRSRGGVGLYYFSGHGAEFEGTNYLLPKGARLSSNRDLRDQALSANRVLNRMEESGAGVNLVFLDCCRNALTKSAGNGLAPMQASGVFVGFATASQKVAQASTDGSLYTRALVKHLGTPGMSITDMHTLVTADVLKESRSVDPSGGQTPFQYSGLNSLFFLRPGTSSMPSVPPPVTARTPKRGSPDREFGNNGYTTFSIGPGLNHAKSVAALPDGSIFVAGQAEKEAKTGYRFAVAKLSASGDRDEAFGGGRVQASLGPWDDGAEAIAVRPDGSVVACGRAEVRGYGYDFGMTRFLSNGQIDSSFGQGGKTITNFGNGHMESAHGTSILVLRDGNLLAGGNVTLQKQVRPAVAKYSSNGQLDPAFGQGGKIVIGGAGNVNSFAQLRDGRIAVIHAANVSGENVPTITVHRPDGKLDASFAAQGRLQTKLNGVATASIVDSEGRLLVSGSKGGVGAILRVLPDGTPDSSFGESGIARSPDANGGPSIGLGFDRRGGIIMGCLNFSLVRLLPDGAVDAGFGDRGVARLSFPIRGNATCMALDSQDRAVLAGQTKGDKAQDYIVVRFRLDQ